MINSVVFFIALLFQYSLWFVYFHYILRSRFSPINYIIIAGMLFVPFCTVRLLPEPDNWVRIILSSALLLVNLAVLFKEKLHRLLLALMSVLIPLALTELFMAVTILNGSVIAHGIGSYYSVGQQMAISAINLSIQMVLLITGYAVWFIISSNGGDKIAVSSWFAFLFFPCSQYILIARWYLSIQDGLSRQEVIFLLITIIMCTLADVALICIIYGNTKRISIEQNNKTLSELINMKAGYYPALAEHYEDMRKLRHDIANHMYTIRILLDSQDIESAKTYADELAAANAYTSTLGSCENHVIDSFLYHRIQQLKNEGIEVSAHISLRENCGISNTELISAFGNMLDNAEEACGFLETESKFIDLLCNQRKGYITISTGNPALPAEKVPKKPRIPQLERGVGSQILSDLAKKYDGNFISNYKDGMYTASLTMKEGSTDD